MPSLYNEVETTSMEKLQKHRSEHNSQRICLYERYLEKSLKVKAVLLFRNTSLKKKKGVLCYPNFHHSGSVLRLSVTADYTQSLHFEAAQSKKISQFGHFNTNAYQT